MKSYEYNAETGKFAIYSMCSKTEEPLMEGNWDDADMVHVIVTAIREAEEIAFRAGQEQVRELMQNALAEVGQKVWAQDYSETCRQKPTETPQKRRKGKR